MSPLPSLLRDDNSHVDRRPQLRFDQFLVRFNEITHTFPLICKIFEWASILLTMRGGYSRWRLQCYGLGPLHYWRRPHKSMLKSPPHSTLRRPRRRPRNALRTPGYGRNAPRSSGDHVRSWLLQRTRHKCGRRSRRPRKNMSRIWRRAIGAMPRKLPPSGLQWRILQRPRKVLCGLGALQRRRRSRRPGDSG